MSEISMRRKGELVRGVFKILIENPEGLPVKAIMEKLERLVKPTEFEQSNYPGTTVRRYDKIIRFSTITSVKAGWLVKSKGEWMITAEGRKAYEKFTDPEEFSKQAWQLYYKWKKARPEPPVGGGDGETPDPAVTLEEA